MYQGKTSRRYGIVMYLTKKDLLLNHVYTIIKFMGFTKYVHTITEKDVRKEKTSWDLLM
jgi:hypothetical protein